MCLVQRPSNEEGYRVAIPVTRSHPSLIKPLKYDKNFGLVVLRYQYDCWRLWGFIECAGNLLNDPIPTNNAEVEQTLPEH